MCSPAENCNSDTIDTRNQTQQSKGTPLEQPKSMVATAVLPSPIIETRPPSTRMINDRTTMSYSSGPPNEVSRAPSGKHLIMTPFSRADGHDQYTKTLNPHQDNDVLPRILKTPRLPPIDFTKTANGGDRREDNCSYIHSPPRSIQLPRLHCESYVSSPPSIEYAVTKQPPSPQSIAHHPHAASNHYYNQQQHSGRQFLPSQSRAHSSQRGHHNQNPTWGHTNQRALSHPKSPKATSNYIRQHSGLCTSPSGSTTAHSSSRSPSEVLKTLLRKKACLYEPGTSLAISLVTWLVGRKLALRNGYFSRQHLQSGVHTVVADKIDSGMITRTKVNRCMQIILNSCFHYIIPRPNGVEENGDNFRESFASKATDDIQLLKSLSHPWDDLEVNDDCLPGDGGTVSSSQENKDADHGDNKRLVLLCFNENVRSAEDVLRCHNEFVRDAAISANLCLSADDWRSFFTRKDEDSSQITEGTAESTTSGGALSSPLVKGSSDNCGIPYLSFDIPTEVSDFLTFKDHVPEPWTKTADALGQMNAHELAKFRTSWCCKRYDHNESMCRFGHVDINKGWLRRNPSEYDYSDTMCPHVKFVTDKNSPIYGCCINTCKDGMLCKFAHSQEEIDYHPKQYKTLICESCKTSYCSCELQDICPFSHPPNNKSSQRNIGRNHGGKRQEEGTNRTKGAHSTDETASVRGAPVLFLSPSPTSEFEKTFPVPGFSVLYRRNCASNYAHSEGKEIAYSAFGNDSKYSSSTPPVDPQRGFSMFSA